MHPTETSMLSEILKNKKYTSGGYNEVRYTENNISLLQYLFFFF